MKPTSTCLSLLGLWLCFGYVRSFFFFLPIFIVLDWLVVRKSKAGEYSDVQGHEALFFFAGVQCQETGWSTYLLPVDGKKEESKRRWKLSFKKTCSSVGCQALNFSGWQLDVLGDWLRRCDRVQLFLQTRAYTATKA